MEDAEAAAAREEDLDDDEDEDEDEEDGDDEGVQEAGGCFASVILAAGLSRCMRRIGKRLRVQREESI